MDPTQPTTADLETMRQQHQLDMQQMQQNQQQLQQQLQQQSQMLQQYHQQAEERHAQSFAFPAAAAAAQPHPYGNKPHPAKPAKFCGKGDSPDVASWLFGMSIFFRASGTSMSDDPSQVAYAASSLEGPAMQWWRSVDQAASRIGGKPAPSTWHEFAAALTQRFQAVNAERVARDKLLALRQDGSVSQFIAQFQQLLLYCPDLSPEEQLHRFINGLKPQTMRELSMREPPDLEAAISMAERFSAIASRTPFQPTPQRQNSGARASTSSATPMDLGATQEEEGFDGADTSGASDAAEQLQHSIAALIRTSLGQGNSGRNRPQQTGASRGGGDSRAQGGRPAQQLLPLTPAQREDCRAKGICFACRLPGHMAFDCPGRPKGRAPPA